MSSGIRRKSPLWAGVIISFLAALFVGCTAEPGVDPAIKVEAGKPAEELVAKGGKVKPGVNALPPKANQRGKSTSH